ncbi:MAG: hypothetical protein JO317_01245 [Verrucomicrobiae bacterium]|nr:hypothetical protein [Verrucomicrobiae bacterium]
MNWKTLSVTMALIAAVILPNHNAEARGRGRHPRAEAAASNSNSSQKTTGDVTTSETGGTTMKSGIHDPGVNTRQRWQRDRIRQGVRSGQLTKGETKQLASEEKDLRQEEKQYKSDGTLTKDERQDLHQDLNQVSKDIYTDKHNDQTQPRGVPSPEGVPAPGTGSSTPGTRDPGVNARQGVQAGRIAQGVKSGALTPDEKNSLVSEEKAIASEEKEYKSDGTLTKDERKDLHQDLNEASKDIYQQKHDDETAK